MKTKLFRTILIITFALLALSALAVASAAAEPTSYNLWVGGVEITSECLTVDQSNCTGVTSGYATYDPATQTLTLDNFVYEGPGYYVREWSEYAALNYMGANALTIELIGESSLKQAGGTETSKTSVGMRFWNTGSEANIVSFSGTDGSSLNVAVGDAKLFSYGILGYSTFLEFSGGTVTTTGEGSSGSILSTSITVTGGTLIGQGGSGFDVSYLTLGDGMKIVAGESEATASNVTGTENWRNQKYVKVYTPRPAVEPVTPSQAADGWYEIGSYAELKGFAKLVNKNKYINARLTAEIEAGDELWQPIGDFRGIFDGQGHTISGLSNAEVEPVPTTVSLFGNLYGKVQKLGLIDVHFRAAATDTSVDVGGIAAHVDSYGTVDDHGTIENCYVILPGGCISGSSEDEISSVEVGGIAGANSGMIKNCYVYLSGGRIMASTSGGSASAFAGGITGYSQMTVQNCYVLGTAGTDITASASSNGGSANAKAIVGGGYCTNSFELTAEEFKDKNKFDGWDFDSVWKMDETLGRPVMRRAEVKAVTPSQAADGWYEIGSYAELKGFAALVNSDESYWSINARLTADIEAGDELWEPIGLNYLQPYKGTIDGQGHTIEGLSNAEVESPPQICRTVRLSQRHGAASGADRRELTGKQYYLYIFRRRHLRGKRWNDRELLCDPH